MTESERMEEYRKLLNSDTFYNCVDDEMLLFQHELVERINRFNRTSDTPDGLAEREQILREALGTYGEGLLVIPPIYANWGLKNVHVGKNVVFNFNVTLVDDGKITIGDDCLIGPNCEIITAQHPIDPKVRKQKMQMNKPVHIGNNVWLGAGAIILPGIRIGDNAVVGAGSVVTHDVEENTVVAGNPARQMKKIECED